jgi:hypothetical protein
VRALEHRCDSGKRSRCFYGDCVEKRMIVTAHIHAIEPTSWRLSCLHTSGGYNGMHTHPVSTLYMYTVTITLIERFRPHHAYVWSYQVPLCNPNMSTTAQSPSLASVLAKSVHRQNPQTPAGWRDYPALPMLSGKVYCIGLVGLMRR